MNVSRGIIRWSNQFLTIGKFLSVLILSMNVMHVLYAYEHVNLDRLFYMSPYKRALDGCMRLCGELDLWKNASSQDEFLVSIELLLGKLVLLKHHVEAMADSAVYISLEDLEYLSEVVEVIRQESCAIVKDRMQDCKELFAQLFAAIQESIKKRIEKVIFNA